MYICVYRLHPDRHLIGDAKTKTTWLSRMTTDISADTQGAAKKRRTAAGNCNFADITRKPNQTTCFNV